MTGTVLLSTRDVAVRLGTSVPTVTRRAREGVIPVAAKAPGLRGAFLFDPADIDALLGEERSA